MASSTIEPIHPIELKTTQGTIYLWKYGKVVLIVSSPATSVPVDGIQVPQGYYPVREIVFIGKANVNNTDIWDQGFRITDSGKITARSRNNNSDIAVTWAAFTCCYITT